MPCVATRQRYYSGPEGIAKPVRLAAGLSAAKTGAPGLKQFVSMSAEDDGMSLPNHAPSTVRTNAHLFTAAAERVTRLYKSPDRNHFCLAANAVTALYREQEAELVRAQHRG